MTKPSLNTRKLGQLMCAATEQVLWPAASTTAQYRSKGHSLMCRVGSGQATYHRFDPSRQQHQITYGAKMIAAKHGPETATGWLSAREITQRNYFGGKLSALNLLAHTCCHEFAHLLQHNAGHRYRGSVHNVHFYRLLDELHTDGLADATRNELLSKARNQDIVLSVDEFELPDPVDHQARWQVGDTVAFSTSTRELHGKILRVNHKTCTVQGFGLSRALHYRVPVQLLRKVENVGDRFR
ncbi:hypothetical protein [Marinobacter sp. CHS3-4]|uniref:hypothetical protein n=1 Tax=Marinobacter sp. CHS3-4 TaxID=3045174 RepID=UPI0024B5D11C|nr:hypothetical protein [Marinobacter sp. CHS3-4]MDI9243644.1 hypothetical protein [Marinobacter sp. CHS3-4]